MTKPVKKMKNGQIKKLTEHQIYTELARQTPGHTFIIAKQSKSYIGTLNMGFRRAGLTSWTKQWKMYNPKTEQEETMYSVRFGHEVEKPKNYRPGAYERDQAKAEQEKQMTQLLAEEEPDLVVADTIERATRHCRERGWNTAKLAISRFDKNYPAKLASLINPKVVEVGA